MKKYNYDTYAITHVGNRVKISIHNYDTDEDYDLDFTQEDLKQFLFACMKYIAEGDFHIDDINKE